MSLTRQGPKYSRHERLASSQLLETKKASTPKLFQKSPKSDQQPFFISPTKAPDYGQASILNHDALKSKIREKRSIQHQQLQQTPPVDSAEAVLNKIVTKIDSNVAGLSQITNSQIAQINTLIKKKKGLTIEASNNVSAIKFKPYSLTPQSRQQSFRLQTSSLKPRSQSQAKRQEGYYLSKIKKAFESNGVDYFSRLYREHFHQTYQALNHKFFPQSSSDYNRSIRLAKKPEHKNKITLFFDLDETLVHCNESPNMPCDVVLEITVSKFQTVRAGINVRPYARELLRNLSQFFEIIVFTASHSCYAEKVVNYLDPDQSFVAHRLYRESCTLTNNQLYTKDLKIFCDTTLRPLSQVALIDNAAYSYAWQTDNGIPILPFYDNKEDKELYDLENYLKNMIGVDDVREYNSIRSNLKLYQFVDQRGPYKVLENLFGKQPSIY